MNLLEETKENLKEHGKKPADVEWVGSADGRYAISWEEFEKTADIEYDNGYGSQEIAYDLVVVGKNWWLERNEYDGHEWWKYEQRPHRKRKPEKIRKLKSDETGWETIRKLNEEKN